MKWICLEIRFEICSQMKISLPKVTSYPCSDRLLKLSNIFYSSGTNVFRSETKQVEILKKKKKINKRSPWVIHSLIDETVLKENTWWAEKKYPKSLCFCHGSPQVFWRRFMLSVLITLAKIGLDILIKSLNREVRCTTTKFPEMRLLNTERFKSVGRNCQM